MMVRHVMRRQQDDVVTRGVQVSVGAVDDPRVRQDDAALGSEVINHKLVVFGRMRRLDRRLRAGGRTCQGDEQEEEWLHGGDSNHEAAGIPASFTVTLHSSPRRSTQSPQSPQSNFFTRVTLHSSPRRSTQSPQSPQSNFFTRVTLHSSLTMSPPHSSPRRSTQSPQRPQSNFFTRVTLHSSL